MRVRAIQTRLPNVSNSTWVAADLLAVAAGEADPVEDCADAVGAATDVDVAEADAESVADVTLLGSIPHSCPISMRPEE